MTPKKNINKRWYRVAWLGVPVLGLINAVFPFILKGILNKYAARIKSYTIKVGGISIQPSQIAITDISVADTGKNTNVQLVKLLTIKSIEISINRAQLWDGMLLGQALVDTPFCSLTKGEVFDTSFKQPDYNIPFIMEYASIINGTVQYTDTGTQPPVSIKAANIDIACYNLTSEATGKELPARAEATASICSGTLNARVNMDAFAAYPTFDMNAEIKNLDMVLLNNFFEAYGKFKIDSGIFEIFTEAAARNGNFKGYVKPVIQNLEMSKTAEQPDGFVNWLKATAIEAFTKIFENPEKDQLATKIPFSGTFKNPEVNVVYAVAETFYNGFISALKPAIDHDIDINSVNK